MATLAYLFPPLTGLAVYFVAVAPRERFHGLQAITLGLLAAVTLYAASAVSSTITPFVFGFWAVVWVGLVGTSLVGRDVRMPLVGRFLQRASLDDPRARS